jgi:hypothetical protein
MRFPPDLESSEVLQDASLSMLAISGQQLAISGQRLAIGGQQSAVSNQLAPLLADCYSAHFLDCVASLPH